MSKKSAFISVIGIPNAGKSTLVNALVGAKVSIVTHKVQTTRENIFGICVINDTQIVFIDTPGIFDAKKNFEKKLTKNAWKGVRDSDMALFVIDAKRGIFEKTEFLIQNLKTTKIPLIIAINKIDLVEKDSLLPLIQSLRGLSENIFMVSALSGQGVHDLNEYLSENAPDGDWMFDGEQITNTSLREMVAEITREKVFLNLHQEIPYSVMIETEKFEETERSAKIHQVIYVEKESQKAIVIGKNAATIKTISMQARTDMEDLLECKVHLFLHVKVRDWK